MTAWDEIRKAIDAGRRERTAHLVSALDEPGRREAARELPVRLKAMRAASEFGFLDQHKQEPLLVAGAGTISGPAAAAAWLCRRDLRLWWTWDRSSGLCEALYAVTATRPDEWRAEVAHRIAARIRVSEETWSLWHIAAAFIRSAAAAPPVTDGFVVGWAADGARPQELAEDPFLETLVPKLFEVDGVGAALADETGREAWDDEYKGTLVDSLAGLARAGRLERAVLLDGCVSRFLRGGTTHNLRWFVRLHTALHPTDDEAAARVRDYVRLLPTAPSTVADLALQQVRRTHDLGHLDTALFAEAADALLFRPEKKLLRAALTWLDRTARNRDRVDATLGAVAALFVSDILDLRERAVKIAAKHASRASGSVRAQIRDAAVDLPADLRETISAAFGEVGPAAEPPPPAGPPPFFPRELSDPIGSLTELADEFALLNEPTPNWRAVERFVAGLVEFAHRDPDATREVLWKTADEVAPWLTNPGDHTYMVRYIRESWTQFPVNCLLHPNTRPTPPRSFRSVATTWTFTSGKPLLQRFLIWRRHEVASMAGKVPVLLATPTEGNGQIDPDVLAGRLELLEKAGTEPGPADLMQAMLRVPREIDAAAVARARGLTSEAGHTVASWFAQGGLTDPAVQCRVLDRPIATIRDRKVRLPTRVVSTVDVPGDSAIADLCTFPEDGWKDSGTSVYDTSADFWPSVLPSHREVAAAHLVPYLAGTEEMACGQGGIMLDLAEADGPTGAATGTLLAYALANKHQDERANTVEALLALNARGDLPATETGTAIGRLASFGRITLPRTVKALTAAADAGAHADVWTTLATALPHVLPPPGEPAPSGAPALLALATRLAETTGAAGAIPAVEDVASRGGSSRLVKESARLHRTLAT